MPNEITNPGPWEYWPVSGHVVDAAGNTVCTIAPDCGEQAKAFIAKAPEAMRMLSDLLSNLSAVLLTDATLTEVEAAIFLEEINEASTLLNSLAIPYGLPELPASVESMIQAINCVTDDTRPDAVNALSNLPKPAANDTVN